MADVHAVVPTTPALSLRAIQASRAMEGRAQGAWKNKGTCFQSTGFLHGELLQILFFYIKAIIVTVLLS